MSQGVDADASLLEASDEVLLRQVHPDQFPNGVLSKVAFFPSPRDQGLLSTRRNRVGAEQACLDWRASSRESVGTWGVSVGEFKGVDVAAYDDSHLPGQPAGHASADFTSYDRAKQVQKGRKLREKAKARGRLFPADQDETAEADTSEPAITD